MSEFADSSTGGRHGEEMQLLKNGMIVLLITTILLLGVLLGFAVYWRLQRAAPVEPVICYARDSFVSSDGKEDFLKYLERDNNYCGDASGLLGRILEKVIDEKYDTSLSPEMSGLNLTTVGCIPSHENDPILQLEDIASQDKPVQGKATKIYWKSGPKSVGGLVHLENEGAVYIRKSGHYYVSSQLTLQPTNTTLNKTTGYSEEHTYRHHVYLISFEKRTERILLEGAKSPCDIAGETSEQTSNMAAVFSLKENDRIYVATSHPYSLVAGHGRNYLTVHLI